MDADDSLAEYTHVAVDDAAPVVRAPTRGEMTALLRGTAATTRARRGSLRALGQVLRVLRCCPWVAGPLRVELAPKGDETTVQVFTERRGVCERVLPAVMLPIPFAELDGGMVDTAHLLAPLALVRVDGKLIFA
jgi:hypothetical protein